MSNNIPTIEDLEKTKEYMDDINEFESSTENEFTDSDDNTRLTITGVTEKANAVLAQTTQNTEDIAAIQADYASILKAASLAVGCELEQIILATDTTTVLDDILYIHDADEQVTYAKPSTVVDGEFIVSVSGGVLTTDVTTYDIYEYLGSAPDLSGLEFDTIDKMVNDGNGYNGTGQTVGGNTVDFQTGQALSVKSAKFRVSEVAAGMQIALDKYAELDSGYLTPEMFGGGDGGDDTQSFNDMFTAMGLIATVAQFRLMNKDYYLSSTVVVPEGVTGIGEGTYDYWGGGFTGSTINTLGSGNAQRWTDIDGNDLDDDTPMLVAGGNGVHLEKMTLKGDWSIGILFPCVKQCGLSRVSAFGFTDACFYLDATWSNRNDTLTALHPEINTSTGMNEFSGSELWCVAGGDGYGVKIQGTTRAWDSVASSGDWWWGWGGTSDIVISDSRLSANGTNVGGAFKHDAQLYGATAFGQGVTIKNCSMRLSGAARYIANLDRSNRILFDGVYAESTGSETPIFAVTSNTQSSTDGIMRVNDKINTTLWLDGVDTGDSGSNVPYYTTGCITVYRFDGRVFSKYVTQNNGEVTYISPDTNGIMKFSNAETGTPVDYLRVQFDAIRPEVAGGISLGTTSFPWNRVSSNQYVCGSTSIEEDEITLTATNFVNTYTASSQINWYVNTGTTSDRLRWVGTELSSYNNADMGSSGRRWSTGYFINSPDVSSDATLKDQRGDLTAVELSAAKAIAKLPRIFQWLGEQEAKADTGDTVYYHCSPMVQDIIAVFEGEGLDYTQYGFVNDGGEDGTMSIQPQELLWMICASQQSQLDDFESRLEALEK